MIWRKRKMDKGVVAQIGTPQGEAWRVFTKEDTHVLKGGRPPARRQRAGTRYRKRPKISWWIMGRQRDRAMLFR